ncbi:esterase [Shimwellia pseudoproteus]|uniref:esterase n=1 Tax=Shimwellia pseudoproteus TaxID=570012 RepID=UPI0018ED5670|nr:esterase [Shimwellia pseudoproteus]MBJ3814514.1 esterase [Shimwellia pseudoproteus]
MKLHARVQTAQQINNNLPLVLIHGLFGSLDNLGVLARDLVRDHPVMQVDLRNHGLSPRSSDMQWAALAADILDTMDSAGFDKATLIGHSMGGKTAMAVTALAPDRIDKLVAIDIAPVNYRVRRHDDIFAGIQAVTAAGVTSRHDATAIMRDSIKEDGVIQFLLKSFVQGEWRFNVPVLWENYAGIVGWDEVPPWSHPAMFICGGDSPYVKPEYREAILRQFPQAQARVIAGTGHWVHAEKPDTVLRVIRQFLSSGEASGRESA